MFTLIVVHGLQKVNDVDEYEPECQPFSDIPFLTVYDALIRVYSNNLGYPLYAPQTPSETSSRSYECPLALHYMEWQERLQNRLTGLQRLYPTQKQDH